MTGWKKRGEAATVQEAVETASGLTAEELLNPEPSPFVKGLSEAVEFYEEHKDGRVTIVGDYDVDGVCSSLILYLSIWADTGREPAVRIPKRLSEGYGLSMGIVDEIPDGLMVTVDNGITAMGQVEAAKAKGLGVIVIDHHLASGEGKLPGADALVDPSAVPGSAFKHYCGAGLAYRFALCITGGDEALRKKLATLAGFATVADMVPLVGANRLLVKESLKNAAEGACTDGFVALLDECGSGNVTEETYGYYAGPMVNAPGRLYDDGAMKAFRLLAMDGSEGGFDSEEYRDAVKQAARELAADNKKRKELADEAVERIEKTLGGDLPPAIVCCDPECPEGIVGIAAGRVAEEHQRPCIVFTESGGKLKGSGRSVPEVHLKELLDRNSRWLLGYGGHSQAAGLSMRREDLMGFSKALAEDLGWFKPGPRENLYDLEITAEGLPGAVAETERFAPYGEGCPAPVFLVKGFKAQKAFVMGRNKEHVSFRSPTASAVGFGMAGKFEELGEPDTINAVGTLGKDSFNGVTHDQITLLDFEKAEEKKKKRLTLDEFMKLA